MKNNVGGIDRSLRIVAGIAVIAAGVFYQNYWGAIGLVPLVTGAIGWCPAYRLFGMSSCSVKANEGHYETKPSS